MIYELGVWNYRRLDRQEVGQWEMIKRHLVESEKSEK